MSREKMVIPDAERDEIIRMLGEGYSYRQISEKLPTNNDRIGRVVDLYDPPRRKQLGGIPKGYKRKERRGPLYEDWELDPAWHHNLSVKMLRAPI